MKEDELTGLLNRGELYKITDKIFKKQEFLSTLYIDISEFIWINHIYGHLEGDKVLVKLGAILKEFANKYEGFAFRIRSEEFILLYPNGRREKTSEIAKNIFNEFQKLKITYTKYETDNETFYLNLSIDIMLLSHNYFYEDDYQVRLAIHEMIKKEKYKQNEKSGVFAIDYEHNIVNKLI